VLGLTLKRFLEALPEGDRGEAALIGVPFDGTVSYRQGAQLGTQKIREASHCLETYSPFLDLDLSGRDYIDWGDLEVTTSSVDLMLDQTEKRVTQALEKELQPVVLGGDHTLSIGVIRALLKRYPDLTVLQLDAHAGYKNEYKNESICHATVMRRISEIIPADRIFRFGIRAGTRDELIDTGIELPITIDSSGYDINELIHSIPEETPLYITVDMDVFDPSLVPGVRNPEPHGLTWREFIQLVRFLNFRNSIGFDVVELAPEYDPTGISAVVAASVVREFMLGLMK